MQVIALIDEYKGRYGVTFPDFPGCTTTADDLDAAVARAAEVLAFHAEGLAEDGPLPRVRTLAELSKDPEFKDAARSSVAVLVPFAPPSASAPAPSRLAATAK